MSRRGPKPIPSKGRRPSKLIREILEATFHRTDDPGALAFTCDADGYIEKTELTRDLGARLFAARKAKPARVSHAATSYLADRLARTWTAHTAWAIFKFPIIERQYRAKARRAVRGEGASGWQRLRTSADFAGFVFFSGLQQVDFAYLAQAYRDRPKGYGDLVREGEAELAGAGYLRAKT